MSLSRVHLASLYRKCLDGNGSSWEELERLYRTDTRDHVARMARRFEEPALVDQWLDDMIQFVWSELLARSREIDPDHFDEELRIFRRRAVVRFLHREQRRRSRVVPAGDDLERLGEERGMAMASEEEPGSPGGGAGRISDPALYEAFEALPEAYREVVRLRLLEDHRFRSVGALLEIPESTARTRFARGVDRLRRLVSGARSRAPA
jgi:RNA polymerase sigma factor (sigma-70 family)